MRRIKWWFGLLALFLIWPVPVALADEPDRTRADLDQEVRQAILDAQRAGWIWTQSEWPLDGRRAREWAQWRKWNWDDGKTFVNQDVTIGQGEVFAGPLGVFDGDLTIEERATVIGDVFVSGGDAEVAGRVTGSLAVINGDLNLAVGGSVAGDVFGMDSRQDIAGQIAGDLSNIAGKIILRSSAVVQGSVLGWPGNIERESGATVGGSVQNVPVPALPFLRGLPGISEWTPPEAPEPVQTPQRPEPPEAPQPPRPPEVRWRDGNTLGHRISEFIARLFGALFLSLVFLAIGALIVIVWPSPTQRVADCLAALPVHSLGLGLLTFLIAAALEVLAALLLAFISVIAAALMATVILIPVGLLLLLLGVLVLLPVPLALLAGIAMGWVALAELVGRRVLRGLKVQAVTPLGAVFVGLVLILAVPALAWVLQPCCLAWPILILLTSLGLGAVMLTRFGSRDCLSAGPARPPVGGPLPPDAMDQEAGRPDVPGTPPA